MSSKKSVEVIIDKKVYTLSGFEEENYLQQVASYMNRKIDELHSIENYARMQGDMKALLLQLNLADDYFKAKEMIENLETELEQRQKEIYDLKHELISKQLKIESDEKALKQKENENKEMLLKQVRMEAAMEKSGSSNEDTSIK